MMRDFPMKSIAAVAGALRVTLSSAPVRIMQGAALLAFFGAFSPAGAQQPTDQRQLQLRIQELKLQQSQQQLMQQQQLQQQQLQPNPPPLQQQQFQLQQLQQQQVQDQQFESLRLQEQQRLQIERGTSAGRFPKNPAEP
jgi:hypothetical protein